MSPSHAVNGREAAPLLRVPVLEAFVDAASDGMCSHDRGRRIASWNRSAERIFGYAEAEAVGQLPTLLFPPHLHAQVERIFDTVFAGDRVEQVEIEARRRQGLPVPISLSVLPVLDDAGTPQGAVTLARDITEQRLGQAVLAETEARLREGEALAHIGRWLWDVSMGAVQWSDELHRIHGVDPLEFEGTFEAHVRYVHPDDRDRVRAALAAALTSGRSFEDEYRIVRPDGKTRWIYSRAEPTIGSDERVVGLRGLGHDVTDRHVSPG
jgi:PAS domain S-box-containing protein